MRSGERFNDGRPTCQMTIVTPPPMRAFSRVSASPCLGLSSVPASARSVHHCPLPPLSSATLCHSLLPGPVSSPSRPRPPVVLAASPPFARSLSSYNVDLAHAKENLISPEALPQTVSHSRRSKTGSVWVTCLHLNCCIRRRQVFRRLRPTRRAPLIMPNMGKPPYDGLELDTETCNLHSFRLDIDAEGLRVTAAPRCILDMIRACRRLGSLGRETIVLYYTKIPMASQYLRGHRGILTAM